MKNKSITFALVMSGLMGIGDMASAKFSFRCQEILPNTFAHGPHITNTQQNLYKLEGYQLTASIYNLTGFNVEQPIYVHGFSIATGVQQKGEPKLESVELINSQLGYENSPICEYKLVFSGLVFRGENNMKITTNAISFAGGLHHCELMGSLFTCP